jgi:hypothetical protein
MRLVRRIRFLLLTVTLCGAQIAAAKDAAETFAGQLVRTILDARVARGEALVYSTDLVTATLRFSSEPPPGDPHSRLLAGLQSVGLTLRPARSGRGFWVVAHRPEARVPPNSAVASNPGDQTHKAEPLLEELLVTSSRYLIVGDGEDGAAALSAAQIHDLPELGEDALRVVSQLPGTASIGVSARPHIRGGQEDETLVVFNQIELLEPFHLRDFQSMFSAVNPGIVKRIDVYTGGFPARFGDRMSGVLDITLTDTYPQLGGELLLSALTTGISGYGSDADGHWVASARKGNLDWLARWINPEVGVPAYADGIFQSTRNLNERATIDVGMLAYRDDIEIRDLDAVDGSNTKKGELARSKDNNAYGWIKWNASHDSGASTTVAFSGSHIRQKRGGFSADESSDEALGTVDDHRRFKTASVQIAHERMLRPSLLLHSGARLHWQKGRYRYRAFAEPGSLAGLLGVADEIDRNIAIDISRTGGNAWASLLAAPGSDLEFEAGLRVERYGLPDNALWRLAPRLRLSWWPFEQLSFSLSGGRYYQGEAISELDVPDGVTEFTQPEFADHYIAAMRWLNDSGWSLRLEAYYKRYGDPAIRHENLFNPLVMLPEIKPDRIRIVPSRGYASGIELSIDYAPDNDLHLWFSWTGARVVDRVAGQLRRRAWDQAHAVRAGLAWNPGQWNVAVLGNWQSGWQTTALPEFIDGFDRLPLDQNNMSLPDFFSLDLRVGHTWQFTEDSLEVWFELVNATGRKNTGGLEHEFHETDSGGYRRLTDERTLLPRVPSIGILWKLR